MNNSDQAATTNAHDDVALRDDIARALAHSDAIEREIPDPQKFTEGYWQDYYDNADAVLAVIAKRDEAAGWQVPQVQAYSSPRFVSVLKQRLGELPPRKRASKTEREEIKMLCDLLNYYELQELRE